MTDSEQDGSALKPAYSRLKDTADLVNWRTPAFWEKLCPALTIGSTDPIPTPAIPDQIDARSSEKARERLRNRGYVLIDSQLYSETDLGQLREGIAKLHANGFPASFILLFDITWDIAAVSRELFRTTCLESNEFQYDILAWHITNEGFSPHRDRQPDDTASSFVGGDAKFVTHWIALTPATPQNSCLYMIPKDHDPGYYTGDTDEDPLRVALDNKTDFQRIVALPRKPGESLLFTHRIIHWGSARDPDASDSLGPRSAISFVCSDPSFEKPYLVNPHFSDKRPPFRIRLLLVCAQLLIYYQRFELPKEVIKICYEVCKDWEKELEETYRHKVYLHFVQAMKESKDTNENAAHSDEEEAILDAMLDAEEGGYGDEIIDDFDDDTYEKDDEDDFGATPPDSKRLKKTRLESASSSYFASVEIAANTHGRSTMPSSSNGQEKAAQKSFVEDEDNNSNGSSSDDDNDEDPRIDAMFARAGVPDSCSAGPSLSKNNRQPHPDLQVTETAIMECFQRAIDAHDNHGNAEEQQQHDIWQAPPLFPNKNASLADWQPAKLGLPVWTTQPPTELRSEEELP